MPKFIPGLQLSKIFFEEAVRPILKLDFPKLKYSAALIGWGSEVLGYDTVQSADHHWGPRVLLFLTEADHKKYKRQISKALSQKLPLAFKGYSTNFSKADTNSVRHMVYKKSGRVNHMVDIFTIKSFLKTRLGISESKKLKTTDWLQMPQQRLLVVTGGAVFHDDIGLNKVRRQLQYYPKDVWLYLLASQWCRISNREAFVGRAGDVGDELGSQIVAARLVREIMRLCFLMEKEYIPYAKWFGTAFKNLGASKKLSPILRKVLLSKNWKEREKHLSAAYSIVAKIQNDLKITKRLPTKTSKYHGRPYKVIHADVFAQEIQKKITDKKLRRLKLIGSVDQFIDSPPINENVELSNKFGIIYV
jgi:hypothetical protein